MDMDEDELFNYCGCKVSEDGKLFILFRETCLGTNIDDALEQERLEKALNDAPTTKDKPMNYEARSSVSKEYTPSIGATQEKLNGILGKDVKLEPGFEAVFDKLKSSSGEGLRDDWDTQVGPFVRMYFEAFVGYLERENFGSDEMLKEGLLEAAEGSEVRFRVVGETKQTYNETVIEDGFVYLQVSYPWAFTLDWG